MKQFFYRIRGYSKNTNDAVYYEWDWRILDLGILDAEDKKKCRLELENIYNKKFCMKSKSEDIGIKNHFLINIYELNDYWRKVWLEKLSCAVCGLQYTKIEQKQINIGLGYISDNCCTEKCHLKRKEDEYTEQSNEMQREAYERSDRGYIYKITNKITNMSYIGKTTQPLTLRWWQHINTNKTEKFGNALKEHKLTDWIFEALEDVITERLDEREKYYMEQFDSIKKGYNTAK